MSDVVKDIRSLVRWVYVTCDTQVAVNVATKCEAVADSHDKLTEQNKMMREALLMIAEQTKNGFTICSECNHQDTTSEHDVLWMAKEALEATK